MRVKRNGSHVPCSASQRDYVSDCAKVRFVPSHWAPRPARRTRGTRQKECAARCARARCGSRLRASRRQSEQCGWRTELWTTPSPQPRAQGLGVVEVVWIVSGGRPSAHPMATQGLQNPMSATPPCRVTCLCERGLFVVPCATAQTGPPPRVVWLCSQSACAGVGWSCHFRSGRPFGARECVSGKAGASCGRGELDGWVDGGNR